MTDTGFKYLFGVQDYHSVNNSKPRLDASKALLEILRGPSEANDDSTRNSFCSTSSSTSSIPCGDISDDYWLNMEETFFQQRKEMALCIYRQFMTRSQGGCDPSQVRRLYFVVPSPPST
ncbi:hypothetical protein FOL47_008878 [Perkinsus chesapeaki]|uniref:Uncharacterized protein n=1 Tax=Perkinsus chesapeaki TaxID=330153 RepID=A0A7J6LBL0_PERCH|nr:hypothetical protein FOL47_008878 [Perkinsus chesapeaki]